jgi:hypothetical protein
VPDAWVSGDPVSSAPPGRGNANRRGDRPVGVGPGVSKRELVACFEAAKGQDAKDGEYRRSSTRTYEGIAIRGFMPRCANQEASPIGVSQAQELMDQHVGRGDEAKVKDQLDRYRADPDSLAVDAVFAQITGS